MKAFFTILVVALCINTHAQIIKTIAGNGIQGYSGDGGQATLAKLNTPSDVAIDASGNLYITDFFNHCVRKIDTNGIITTVAGNGTAGYSGDGGFATVAQVGYPKGIAIDNAGNLYVSQEGNSQVQGDCVRKIDVNGIITTIAGTGVQGYSGDGGLATAAQLWSPCGIKVDAADNLFIADYNNGVVRKVNSNGIISTVAGIGGSYGYNGDGIAATSAQLKNPYGIALDKVGNFYITDTWNHRVRKVDTNGIITTVAGNGTLGYSGDGGQANLASLYAPIYITVDTTTDNLYISDYYNHRVRKINANGIISTIAGIGTLGYSGDCGQATSAKLNQPCGIALGTNGKIYIADESNNRVRVLYPSSTLSITASATTVCSGQSVTLSVNGSNTYTWSTLQIGTVISVTPFADAVYAVYSTDNYGCHNSTQIIISISPCTSVDELNIENKEWRIYPNPIEEIMNVEFLVFNREIEMQITDVLGNVIKNSTLNTQYSQINASNLKSGIYYIKIGNTTRKFVKK